MVQNGNEITATSNNEDGIVQIQDGIAYSQLTLFVTNVAPGGADGFDIGIGACFDDIPGDEICPYDLYVWKKDDLCRPVYRDSAGVFYEKDQNNNNIASIGEPLWVDTPRCGTITFLESNAVDDNDCDPDFTCDANPLEIQFHAPAGDECMFYQYWDGVTVGIEDPWDDIFTATDAFGNPAHPSAFTSDGSICNLQFLGDVNGTTPDLDQGGATDEQAQLDGWLYIPNQTECINFRIGANTSDQSVALFVGTGVDDLELLVEDTDGIGGFPNTPNGDAGAYCLPGGIVTTNDDRAWQILRVRIYAHDEGTGYNPQVEWSFNGGLTWQPVGEEYIQSATSADDNTPPVGSGMSGCDPIPTTIIRADDVLVDDQGLVWDVPGNCNRVPTNLYEPPGAVGSHISLSPYTVVYNDDVMFTCDPCSIDIDITGCACNDPENEFADDCPQSVTAYRQTAIVSSEINNSYTITDSTGIIPGSIEGPFNVSGSGGDDKRYTFLVTPGTPYTITFMGDDSETSQTFMGYCAPPDDCNCPTMPEICGDGLDNDCDGFTDEADSDIVGNCALDCEATPIEIQGRAPALDGKLTHQVWSRKCGNTGCCSSSINPHSCALLPFTCMDVNGLPAHQSSCAPPDPCGPGGGGGGTAGCVGNDEFSTLGSVEKAHREFFSSGGRAAEQVQLDGWLVLPAGVTCFALRVNHPKAWDAQAVYIGEGIASMNFVGATSFPPLANFSTPDQDANGECTGMTNVTGTEFQYDVSSGSTPITVAGCTWHVLRVRSYIFDESFFHVTPVQWNLGDGYEVIPSQYFQSVGDPMVTPDAWDTDNNKPTAADIVELAPFCAYEDADGDLFLQNGDFYTLDTRKCEQIVTNDCLACPDNLTECEEGECAPPPIVDENGDPLMDEPMCDLYLFEITPQEATPPTGIVNGLNTIYWDHNQASCASNEIKNSSIFLCFQRI